MTAVWKRISQGLILGTALTVAGQAQAAAGDADIGLLLGWAAPKDVDSRPAFGLEGNYEIIDNVALGAYVQYNWKSATTLGVKNKVSLMPFGVKVNYLFNDFAPGLYAGVNLGMVRTSAKATVTGATTSTSVSSTDFSAGAQVGYDFSLATEFSLGLAYEYMWINGDPDAGHLHNFFLSAKYHF